MKKKLVVIIGPTASKKTTIAHQISLKLNGSIINADAFQIYKELSAGVNKPDLKKLSEVDYYLINIKQLNENYNIKEFQEDFKKSYDEIINKNKLPILCGGSHLYIDSVLNGYDLSINLDKELNIVRDWSIEELSNFVKKYDLVSYEKNINNIYRLQRCAAYLLANDKRPKSILEKQTNKIEFNPLIIMVYNNREFLYKKINQRFDEFLINNNWIDEVKNLNIKYGEKLKKFQGMKAIGYLEILESIKTNTKIDIELIKQKTRKLAKHQLTWCNNKFHNKVKFDPTVDKLDDLIKLIQDYYAN
ncbi:MAG: tRNA (adenosine(37)-N6)-dimethylallyltransferase MiaA [Ureaplasma sp.]|nr:tRNA (adenosine(37)-N6)-dimethylallyltransferase MiaA [Ureaplasma sp.]